MLDVGARKSRAQQRLANSWVKLDVFEQKAVVTERQS
jgi:hypothetical protein